MLRREFFKLLIRYSFLIVSHNLFCVRLFSQSINDLILSKDSCCISINVFGVPITDIKLIGYNGKGFSDEVAHVTGVKEASVIKVPTDKLPGQFILRFDYRAKEGDTPYPSELPLFLNKNDIGVSVNPMQVNKTLQITNDTENTEWAKFQQENGKRRINIMLLEQVLTTYSITESDYYRNTRKEYRIRVQEYNEWLTQYYAQHSDLFISHFVQFQKIPVTEWYTDSKQQLEIRKQSWFQHFDFSDTVVINTQEMNNFMSGYVGLYTQQATEKTADSLLVAAGTEACMLASKGHPKVYGWMADYFYTGYETYNIAGGIKMLEKHIENPNCLTRKKMEIITRLEGMKKLVPGYEAPEIEMKTAEGKELTVNFDNKKSTAGILVLFYHSDCSHCKEMLGELAAWYAVPANRNLSNVITIAVDSDEAKWREYAADHKYEWLNGIAPGGINSKAARSYFVLSTPSLIIVDRTGKIAGTPATIKEAIALLLHNKGEESAFDK